MRAYHPKTIKGNDLWCVDTVVSLSPEFCSGWSCKVEGMHGMAGFHTDVALADGFEC